MFELYTIHESEGQGLKAGVHNSNLICNIQGPKNLIFIKWGNKVGKNIRTNIDRETGRQGGQRLAASIKLIIIYSMG